MLVKRGESWEVIRLRCIVCPFHSGIRFSSLIDSCFPDPRVSDEAKEHAQEVLERNGETA